MACTNIEVHKTRATECVVHILMQGYGAQTQGAFEARLGPLGPKLNVRLSSYRLITWRMRVPRVPRVILEDARFMGRLSHYCRVTAAARLCQFLHGEENGGADHAPHLKLPFRGVLTGKIRAL
jgi:hypothetical protein